MSMRRFKYIAPEGKRGAAFSLTAFSPEGTKRIPGYICLINTYADRR